MEWSYPVYFNESVEVRVKGIVNGYKVNETSIVEHKDMN